MKFPILYGLFFVANGVLVILEGLIKANLKQYDLYKTAITVTPRWLFHLYGFAVIFYLNHKFFWPELNEVSIGKDMVHGVMCFLKIADGTTCLL